MARNFTTDADIRDDVDQALQGAPGYPADYDIDGIVREIIQTVGIDGYADMDETDFYAIVARHDSTQA